MISGAHIYPFPTLGDDLFDDCGGSGKFFRCTVNLFTIVVSSFPRSCRQTELYKSALSPATVSGMPPEVLDMNHPLDVCLRAEYCYVVPLLL